MWLLLSFKFKKKDVTPPCNVRCAHNTHPSDNACICKCHSFILFYRHEHSWITSFMYYYAYEQYPIDLIYCRQDMFLFASKESLRITISFILFFLLLLLFSTAYSLDYIFRWSLSWIDSIYLQPGFIISWIYLSPLNLPLSRCLRTLIYSIQMKMFFLRLVR